MKKGSKFLSAVFGTALLLNSGLSATYLVIWQDEEVKEVATISFGDEDEKKGDDAFLATVEERDETASEETKSPELLATNEDEKKDENLFACGDDEKKEEAFFFNV